MFEGIRSQDKASRVEKIAGNFDERVKLYKAFREAIDKQDKIRAPRLSIKLDNWYSTLSDQSKTDFCAVLIQKGLITGALKSALEVFEGRIVKFS